MPVWELRKWEGEPHGAEGQALAWVDSIEIADASKYPMPPADVPLIEPIVAAMRKKQ